MCVSNEPCRLKEEKSAVLAQSTFRRFQPIGRMPDSPGKLKAFSDEHGEQTQQSRRRASERSNSGCEADISFSCVINERIFCEAECRARQREFASAGREQNCACTKFCFKFEEDRANARQSGKAESFPGQARRRQPKISKAEGERPSRAAASARIRECGQKAELCLHKSSAHGTQYTKSFSQEK